MLTLSTNDNAHGEVPLLANHGGQGPRQAGVTVVCRQILQHSFEKGHIGWRGLGLPYEPRPQLTPCWRRARSG